VAFFDGSFEQMKSNAHLEQKPYLLSFHDEGIPSRNLERFTYTNPQLANYIANNYLAMEFSIDNLDEAAENLIDRYQVILFPTIVLFSSEGKMLYRFTGFTGDQAFIKMLETYRYQTETDMSMTFPPEPFASLKVESVPSIKIEDKNPKPQADLDSDLDEIVITELIDLEDNQVAQIESSMETQEESIIIDTPLFDEQAFVEQEDPEAENLAEIPVPIVAKSKLIVQTGVYSKLFNAQQEQNRIQSTYTENVSIDPLEINGKTLYRVRIGPFRLDQEATDILQMYNSSEKLNAIIKTQ